MATTTTNTARKPTPEQEAENEAFLERGVPIEFIVECPKGHLRKLSGTIKGRDLLQPRPAQQLTLDLERVEILLADRAGWHPALPLLVVSEEAKPAEKPKAPTPREVGEKLIATALEGRIESNERVMLLAEARQWFELAQKSRPTRGRSK